MRIHARFPALSIVFITGLALAACEPSSSQGQAAGTPSIETEEEKTAYALGHQLGTNLASLELSESELDALAEGLSDAARHAEPRLDVGSYQEKIRTLARDRANAAVTREVQGSQEFLEAAAGEPGAERRESGIIVTALEAGTGESPGPTDTVRVHYEGTFRDGTVFDSSRQRGEPVSFPLNRVIPCWTEVVQTMKVGGKLKAICPPETAYGARGAPPRIPPGATLIFEIELLEVKK